MFDTVSSATTPPEAYDVDWLVVGSGFGGSVSALRLAEKGYSVSVLEAGRRFEDADFPRSTWDLRRYFYAPRLGLRGIFRLSLFKDVTVVSGAGVGGGWLGYACTLYRPPADFYRDPQWAGPRGLGGGARAAPRHGRADARRGRGPRRRPRRRPPARGRRGARLRELLRQDPCRDLLRRGRGRPRRGSVLRRRGPRAPRLRRVRALHGRLPARGEEHAGQELPRAGRAPRRADRAGAHGRRDSAGGRARRLGGLRGRLGALGRLGAQAPPGAPGPRRRGRRRGPGHQPAARALPPRRLAPAPVGPARGG